MQLVDLLNYIENSVGNEYFTNLHIVNNNVVGFYKTIYVTYEDVNKNTKPYLFPTTFKFVNNRIHTTMVFGSVISNFTVPHNINGTGYGTKLVTLGVGNHLYKLLTAIQTDSPNNFNEYSFHLKAFMGIILDLESAGFPFMRIADNTSIVELKDFN